MGEFCEGDVWWEEGEGVLCVAELGGGECEGFEAVLCEDEGFGLFFCFDGDAFALSVDVCGDAEGAGGEGFYGSVCEAHGGITDL